MRILSLCAALLCAAQASGQCDCVHGGCISGGSTCLCRTSELGYWGGDRCSDCAFGYAGATCQTPCEGGACNPCNGHGTCDAGYSGTGRCDCYNSLLLGRWDGAACGKCQPGYYGADCKNQCPSLDTCHGHGVCSEGRGGDGTCVCEVGWDGAGNCVDCVGSRWGDCRQMCKATVEVSGVEIPCSGHGECSHGMAGTGECISCGAGWAGEVCEIPCQCLPAHGTCDSGVKGDGSCKCNNRRLPPDCAQCEQGYGGADCSTTCPGNPRCQNRGVCDAMTAICTCSDGYTGISCNRACPGNPPCNRNGLCVKVGTPQRCQCHDDDVRGHWDGPDCATCATGYEAESGCRTRELTCPQFGGRECSARGRCLQGACHCDRSWTPPSYADFCGVACQTENNVTSPAIECVLCSKGYYGTGCTQRCPGFIPGLSQPCNDRGVCTISGRCVCYPPTPTAHYVGTACEVACPLDPEGRPCGYPAYGLCNAAGACVCRAGVFGRTCDGRCPVSSGMVCNNRGVCRDGAAGDGVCECVSGWTGDACETTCLCSGHATCVSGRCECETGFNGTGCDVCGTGLYGPACDQKCFGTTEGKACRCNATFAGEDCSTPCREAAGVVCSGQGTCRAGNAGDGGCDCEPTFFGDVCGVRCNATECGKATGRLHPACDSQGACVCHTHWDGVFCDRCHADWWGPDCEKECACNSHGVCDRETGECTCRDSDLDGHFTGSNCEKCAEGFAGDECRSVRVCTTQGKSLEPIVIDPQTNSIRPLSTYPPYGLWVDTRSGGGYVYIGGHPLVAWSSQRPQDDVVTLDSNSTVSGVLRLLFAAQGNLYIVFAPGRQAATQLVTLSPVPRPPTFGTGRPFSNDVVQSLSDVAAEAAAHYEDERGEVVVFHTEGALLRATALGCAGSTAAACRSAQIPLPRESQVIASGPEFVFLAFEDGDSWSVRSARWNVTTAKAVVEPALEIPLRGLPKHLTGGSVKFLQSYGRDSVVTVVSDADARLHVVRLRANSTDDVGPDDWVPLSKSAVVTAAVVDNLLGACFLGVLDSQSSQPGQLYKVSLRNRVYVYDTSMLSHTVVRGKLVPEVISAMYVDDRTRTLYALVSPDASVKVLSFLLWEVGSTDPQVSTFAPPAITTDGGTPLVVTGRGFQKLVLGDMIPGVHHWVRGGVDCRWGSDQTNDTITKGTILNDTAIECVAPFTSTDCEYQEVEISLDGHRLTDCEKRLLRVPPSSIQRVSPSRGTDSGGTIVTVFGTGFVDTAHLACRFALHCSGEQAGNQACGVPCESYTEVLETKRLDVTFVSPSVIHCVQPPSLSSGSAILDVTLDGCKSSNNMKVFYSIVGIPAGLDVVNLPVEALSPLAVPFAPTTVIPRLDISLIDVSGTLILAEEASQRKDVVRNRPVHVELVRREPNMTGGTLPHLQGSLAQFIDFSDTGNTSGVAVFEDVEIVWNSTLTGENFSAVTAISAQDAARYSLRFADGVNGWTKDVRLLIVSGLPYALQLEQQPSAMSYHNAAGAVERPLKAQPAVEIVDRYGNVVASAPKTYVVTCTVTDELVFTKSAVAQREQPTASVPKGARHAKFDGVSIRPVFGVKYRLHFEAEGLQSVYSHEIVAELCAAWQYQPVSDPPTHSKCRLCPGGAICNGTDVMVSRPGYWRHSEASLEFKKCLMGTVSEPVCVGGAATGECVAGYEGPLCAVCSAGYTTFILQECVSCRPALHVVLFIATALAVVAAVAIVTVKAETQRSDKKMKGEVKALNASLAATVRILLGHMQRFTLLGGLFFSDWGPSLHWLVYVFATPSGQVGLDCWMRSAGLTQTHRFFAFVVALFLVAFMCGLLSFLYLRYVRGTRQDRQAGRQRRRKRVMLPILLLKSASLVVFLMYTELLRNAAMLLRCDEGSAGGEARLLYDMRVGCGGASFVGAVAVLVVVGVFFPCSLFLSKYLAQRQQTQSFSAPHPVHGTAAPRDQVLVDRFFSFYTSGCLPSAFFWEGTEMLERLVLCLSVYVFFGADTDRQLVAVAWVAFLSLILHIYVRPYDTERNNTLAILSHVVQLLTVYCVELLHGPELNDAEASVMRAVVAAQEVLFVIFCLFTVYSQVQKIRKESTVDCKEEPGRESSHDSSQSKMKEDPKPTTEIELLRSDPALWTTVTSTEEDGRQLTAPLLSSLPTAVSPLVSLGKRAESSALSADGGREAAGPAVPSPLLAPASLESEADAKKRTDSAHPLTRRTLLGFDMLDDPFEVHQCTYCSATFTELLNTPGACAASPQTAKRHLAGFQGSVCAL